MNYPGGVFLILKDFFIKYIAFVLGFMSKSLNTVNIKKF